MSPAREVYTAAGIQKIDRWAIEKIGIPSLVLMDRAGEAVAREVLKIFPHRRKVLVVCGNGNNGGDGFVAARYLYQSGIDVRVVVTGGAKDLKTDSKVYYSLIKKLRIPVQMTVGNDQRFLRALAESSIVVDALFGVGLNRRVRSPYREIIDGVNDSGKKVLAVDVPSGLDATTGEVLGACVRADATVTFTAAKTGFFLREGPRMTGRLVVRDIGIPLPLRKH